MGMLPNFLAKRPLPAEHDLAGIVEDPNGSTFAKGDAVIGFIPVRKFKTVRPHALPTLTSGP